MYNRKLEFTESCEKSKSCNLAITLNEELTIVRKEMKSIEEVHEENTGKTRKLVWLSIFIGVVAEIATAVLSKG